MDMTLPTDSAGRKRIPLWRGLFRYAPAALAGVAQHSMRGNAKHSPGSPELRHIRRLSTDHGDCILRHLTDIGDLLAALDVIDASGAAPTEVQRDMLLSEFNALCWRALMWSQEIHEHLGSPVAPAASFKETTE